ncbi:MAG: glutathione S-transferase [Rhodobacteraceae bacterium]|nr:glutathione S-transferase [Paracoccaceae bacterium]
MTCELAIGDRTHSSWSLRGWLPFAVWNIPVRVHTARLYTGEVQKLLENFAPSRLVPALKKDGIVVYDTLAIAETLAETYPHKPLWPTDPLLRAKARSMAAEMHSAYGALRAACPMNLAHSWAGFVPSEDVLEDCARIEFLWADALDASGGPWLCGEYSLADVFLAPVAMRFATYGLPRTDQSQTYIDRHLAEGNFRRWRAMGRAENHHQPFYDFDLAKSPWPGPAPLAAAPVDAELSINDVCPYSGRPVTDFLELDGRVYGFCNRFCRDRTVADPQAWPAFMALIAP